LKASLNWSNRMSTAVFIGKRGAGKSTTLNSLFGLSLTTDPAVECTIRPNAFRLSGPGGPGGLGGPGGSGGLGELDGLGGRPLRVVDMPGIAANLDSAGQYRRYYRKWMRRANVVVWVTQADVRSYKQDQIFFTRYSRMVSGGTRLVVGISKIDTLPGRHDPDDAATLDGSEVILRKVADVRAQVAAYSWVGRQGAAIVPYSIYWNWNVGTLRDTILSLSQKENTHGHETHLGRTEASIQPD
jgi:predicted GTPase